MTFDDILGQRHAVELLRAAIASQRLPHALLFHGPEGVGKRTIAKVLAATLLCSAEGDRPCGRCSPCVAIERGHHPDLLFVRHLPKEKYLTDAEKKKPPMGETLSEDWGKKAADLSQFILVYQIRALIEHAAFAPREGRFRIFLIDPAETMNPAAQNALLKTLEEPPGSSILILVTARPHLLLPTVRSRCFAVGFGPLRASELAARLTERHGLDRDEARTRAALSGGSPGRALDLDLDSLRARRDEIAGMLEALAGKPRGLAELGGFASTLAGRDLDDLLEGLELLEGLLRDAARSATGFDAETLLNGDLAGDVRELGGRLGVARAAELVRAVERVRGYLRFNVNRTIVAESLLAAVAGAPAP